MTIKTVIRWKYLPSDFFEAPVDVALGNGRLSVGAGEAALAVPGSNHVVTSHSLRILTEEVSAVFEARQLLTHKLFELKEPNITHYQPDGSIGTSAIVSVPTFKAEATFNAPDIKVISADGTVTSDTRAARLSFETSFVASIASKQAVSPVLRAMLKSYHQALRDPQNALIHLYEIRDAIFTYYGNEKKAGAALQISKKDLNSLGRLANHEPLREGRHRGQMISKIRPATEEELVESRRVAVLIIKAFSEALGGTVTKTRASAS